MQSQNVFDDFDVVVAPTSGEQLVITNLTGHPAVILPNGLRGSDAPKISFGRRERFPERRRPRNSTSLTFFSEKLYGEAELLAFARAYQKRRDFISRHPKLAPGPKRSRMSHSLAGCVPFIRRTANQESKKAESWKEPKTYFLRSARVRWSLNGRGAESFRERFLFGGEAA